MSMDATSVTEGKKGSNEGGYRRPLRLPTKFIRKNINVIINNLER